MSADLKLGAVKPVCRQCKLLMKRHSTQAVEGHEPHQVTVYSCEKCARMGCELTEADVAMAHVA